MAISNPCALLDRLLREPAESEWLEFKHNQSNVEEIGEYISALANAAMLADKDRAFLVFGVEDGSREKAGTAVRLKKVKKGAKNFENWIARLIEPGLMNECLDFSCDGLDFAIIVIEPSYQRPVRFSGIVAQTPEEITTNPVNFLLHFEACRHDLVSNSEALCIFGDTEVYVKPDALFGRATGPDGLRRAPNRARRPGRGYPRYERRKAHPYRPHPRQQCLIALYAPERSV
jgi:Putative DNA-binding domain